MLENNKLLLYLAGWGEPGKGIYDALKSLAVLKWGERQDDFDIKGIPIPNNKLANQLLNHLSGAIPLGGVGKLRVIHKVMLATILYQYITTDQFDKQWYDAIVRCDRDYYWGGPLHILKLPPSK